MNSMALKDDIPDNKLYDSSTILMEKFKFYPSSTDSNTVVKTLFNNMLTKVQVYVRLVELFEIRPQLIHKWLSTTQTPLKNFTAQYITLRDLEKLPTDPYTRIKTVFEHYMVKNDELNNIMTEINVVIADSSSGGKRRSRKVGGIGNPFSKDKGKVGDFFEFMDKHVVTQTQYDNFKAFLKGLTLYQVEKVKRVIKMLIPSTQPPSVSPPPTAQPPPPPQSTAPPAPTQIRKTKFNKNEIAAYTNILKAVSGLDITILKSPNKMYIQANEDDEYHQRVKKIYNTVKGLIDNFKLAEDILVNYHGIIKDNSISSILTAVTDLNKDSYQTSQNDIIHLNKLLKSLNKVVKNVEKWMNKLELCPKK